MPTRWKLDSCDCVMITDSGATSNDFPVLVQAETVCSVHQVLLPDHTVVYSTVKDENTRKSKAHQQLIDNAPASWFDPNVESGVKQFKKGIALNWSWSGTSPNRVIVFTLTGVTLTTNQKNNAQNLLDSTFGVGKAILVN